MASPISNTATAYACFGEDADRARALRDPRTALAALRAPPVHAVGAHRPATASIVPSPSRRLDAPSRAARAALAGALSITTRRRPSNRRGRRAPRAGLPSEGHRSRLSRAVRGAAGAIADAQPLSALVDGSSPRLNGEPDTPRGGRAKPRPAAAAAVLLKRIAARPSRELRALVRDRASSRPESPTHMRPTPMRPPSRSCVRSPSQPCPLSVTHALGARRRARRPDRRAPARANGFTVTLLEVAARGRKGRLARGATRGLTRRRARFRRPTLRARLPSSRRGIGTCCA